MKKNLAKKIVLGLLTGAVLMSSSVAWAGHVVEATSEWGCYKVVDGVEQNVTIAGGGSSAAGKNSVAVGYNSGSFGDYSIAIGANLIGQAQSQSQSTFTTAKGEGGIAIGADSSSGGDGGSSPALSCGSPLPRSAAAGGRV